MATATIDRSIDLDCSQHDAFEKLSRYDFYAQFPDVADLEPRGGNRAHLVADVEGRREEFDLELDQRPEEHVELRTTGDPTVASAMDLEPLDDAHTRLRLHVEYDSQLKDRYHLSEDDLEQRVRQRLETIKEYAESPGA